MKRINKSLILIIIGLILIGITIFLLFKFDVFETSNNSDDEVGELDTLASKKIKISFDGNGGKVGNKSSVRINKGSTVESLPTPTRKNYVFVGWYEGLYGGDEITTNTIFNEATRVYAMWASEDKPAYVLSKYIITLYENTNENNYQLDLIKIYIDNGEIKQQIVTNEAKWSVEQRSLATVDNGLVTAVKGTKKSGQETVAIAKIDGKELFCFVDVETKAESIDISNCENDNISLKKKGNIKLKAVVSPSRTTNKEVTWTSSNTNIATVNKKTGAVKAKSKTGVVEITATADGLTTKCRVVVGAEGGSVEVVEDEIVLDNSAITINKGKTKTLKATKKNNNTSINKELSWESSNKKVATVSSSGKVKGVGAGEAIITAKTKSGKTVSCKVTVNDNSKSAKVSKVSLDNTAITLNIGNTKKLNVTITPSNATNTDVTWTSNKTSVATVENGVVTAKKAGTATITAKVGGKTAKCKVTVNKQYTLTYNANGGIVSPSSISLNNGAKYGKLPTPKRDNYEFLGWYTQESGGTKVSENTTITKKTTIYAHWNYDITEHVPAGFNVSSSRVYSSSTLKYKVLTPQGNGKKYSNYALVWVKDANKQINNGNSNYTYKQKITHFNNEITKYGYQKKGIIGINGGFATNGRDNVPILATRGVYTRNTYYKSWIISNNKPTSNKFKVITIDKSGNIIRKQVTEEHLDNYGVYTGSNTEKLSENGYKDFEKWLKDNGGRNTWAVTHFTTKDWKEETGGADQRTSLCQVDEHNFVLAVGYTNIHTGHKELHDIFGCKTTINMDGGGSTGMYYKTNAQDRIQTIYQYKRPNETTYRDNVDILYFSE